MKKQWGFVALMLALVMMAALSMPVMAEQLVAGALDKVQVQEASESTTEDSVEYTASVTNDATDGVKLSEAALAKLSAVARQAYEGTFGAAIPADYQPIETTMAYMEERDLRYGLSLVPQGWESFTSALPSGADGHYYYIQFGSVDAEAGTGEVIGMQRFKLSYDDGVVESPDYTQAQKDAMDAAARAFAGKLGFIPSGDGTMDKVSGSYDQGLQITYPLDGGDTISVTVSEAGEVSGYSLVAPKG